MIKNILLLLQIFFFWSLKCVSQSNIATSSLPVIYSSIGDSILTSDQILTIKCIGQKHGYKRDSTYDPDIYSPKSVGFTPDGSKFYINSLEGFKTVVYDTRSLKKLKTIVHEFESGTGELWLSVSGYYPFIHYPEGGKKKFKGKPVEMVFSKDGKYLFVPYYRRSFDINAQDPSALAVIDTSKDSIVLMAETGPLPKMVSISNDGCLLAVTHWGDNTMGFMDISDSNPRNWHYLPPVIIGHKLTLNYSLSKEVNRDTGSGYSLRGTYFLPGDSILLIGAMGGPTAVINLKKMEWIGMINSLNQIRHIEGNNDHIFMSRNISGEIFSVPIDSLTKAITNSCGDKKEIKVEGIKKVKVGGGARTLKLTPDGKYILVACNSGSALYVIDSYLMKTVGQLPVDSYPVGLDISPDGKYVVITSQGRSGIGGNAVNIFNIRNQNRNEIEDSTIMIDSFFKSKKSKNKLFEKRSEEYIIKFLSFQLILPILLLTAGILSLKELISIR